MQSGFDEPEPAESEVAPRESNMWLPMLNAFYRHSTDRRMIVLCDFVTALNVVASCNLATIIAPVSHQWMETSAVTMTESEEEASTGTGSSCSSANAAVIAPWDFVER